VLKGPLSEVGAKTYHVTGPWQEPKVEVIVHDAQALREAESSAGALRDDAPPALEAAEDAASEDAPVPSVPVDTAVPAGPDHAESPPPAHTHGQDAAEPIPPPAQTPPPPAALPPRAH